MVKYVSIDIETSALEPKDGLILQVAAVVFDVTIANITICGAAFNRFIKYTKVLGEARAIQMNPHTLKRSENEGSPQEYIVEAFKEFLSRNVDKETFIIGKNVVAFDLPWIKHHLNIDLMDYAHRRVVDVGSYGLDLVEGPMGLDDLKKSYGVKGEVTHDALDDAMDVMNLAVAINAERCLKGAENESV